MKKENFEGTNRGYLYVLSNPAFKDGIFKIGVTRNIEDRLSSLDNTSVPLPFKVEHLVALDNYEAVESALHRMFDKERMRSSREFFFLEGDQYGSIINLLKVLSGDKSVSAKKAKTKTNHEQYAVLD